MLVLTRCTGEKMLIGDDIEVTVSKFYAQAMPTKLASSLGYKE
ncbi:carbon storage regulator [Halieaceae bacterium IMCC14734]|uniref:Carbon storage regulator n=1 Tax=Candidatus Litorirhabdus singularis TaxID=2518993 RepID=A0ABT3TE80_9GAMM|nr:carbon storage regulator [Candidatus Litorirhabdus singularis]